MPLCISNSCGYYLNNSISSTGGNINHLITIITVIIIIIIMINAIVIIIMINFHGSMLNEVFPTPKFETKTRKFQNGC